LNRHWHKVHSVEYELKRKKIKAYARELATERGRNYLTNEDMIDAIYFLYG